MKENLLQLGVKLKRISDAGARSDRNWEIVGAKSSVTRNIVEELDDGMGWEKKTLPSYYGVFAIRPLGSLFFVF